MAQQIQKMMMRPTITSSILLSSMKSSSSSLSSTFKESSTTRRRRLRRRRNRFASNTTATTVADAVSTTAKSVRFYDRVKTLCESGCSDEETLMFNDDDDDDEEETLSLFESFNVLSLEEPSSFHSNNTAISLANSSTISNHSGSSLRSGGSDSVTNGDDGGKELRWAPEPNLEDINVPRIKQESTKKTRREDSYNNNENDNYIRFLLNSVTVAPLEDAVPLKANHPQHSTQNNNDDKAYSVSKNDVIDQEKIHHRHQDSIPLVPERRNSKSSFTSLGSINIKFVATSDNDTSDSDLISDCDADDNDDDDDSIDDTKDGIEPKILLSRNDYSWFGASKFKGSGVTSATSHLDSSWLTNSRTTTFDDTTDDVVVVQLAPINACIHDKDRCPGVPIRQITSHGSSNSFATIGNFSGSSTHHRITARSTSSCSSSSSCHFNQRTNGDDEDPVNNSFSSGKSFESFDF